jgi:hypothetical protein
MTVITIFIAVLSFFLGFKVKTGRTKEDNHREICYPHMLMRIKESDKECNQLRSKINEQEASVTTNRTMYKIAENVVREQATEIEFLKNRVEELEKLISTNGVIL